MTRHARTTQAWVTVEEVDGRVAIQIRDNGRGFDSEGKVESGHYGLLGLRERARLAGGDFLIKSDPGMGTSLSMSLPGQNKNGESA